MALFSLRPLNWVRIKLTGKNQKPQKNYGGGIRLPRNAIRVTCMEHKKMH